MLSHIQIRNFAIIESLDLDLSPGLTVITGETGAGKSIMIDAMGLVLGDRADSNTVRHGADKAEISLHIELQNPDIENWLAEHDLEADGECVLRRVITAEGRSRNYINGSSTTLAMMKQLGDQLVNIHGQHAHQHLMQGGHQRDLLDAYGGYASELDRLHQAFDQWQHAHQALEQARAAEGDRLARIDLLRFQLEELLDLDPGENEYPELERNLRRLSHADQLKQTSARALDQIRDAEQRSIIDEILGIERSLEAAQQLDDSFSEVCELISSARIQLEEAADSLSGLFDSFDIDPDELAMIEERYNRSNALAEKHHILPETLFQRLAEIREELRQLEAPESGIEALTNSLRAAAAEYDQAAATITRKRQTAAKKLNKIVSEAMQGLGMEGGSFKVEMTARDPGERHQHGAETICFLVATNPGQPFKPLSGVASGGELSRLSLAIELAATRKKNLPTLIFDEVDSGIGGAVAEVVGQQLRALGENSQVLCVTHLPQVAACGHQHLQVQKTKTKTSTHTRLESLSEEERMQEIARMLGGKTMTKQSLAHAEQMLGLNS
ncbi:MAG: DNA repair protein RecN [Thiotrichales bacterium]